MAQLSIPSMSRDILILVGVDTDSVDGSWHSLDSLKLDVGVEAHNIGLYPLLSVQEVSD